MNTIELNTEKRVKTLSRPLYGASVGSAILSRSFGPPSAEMVVTVPDDYIHETYIGECLSTIRSEMKVSHLSSDFVDENFNKVTNRLKAGFTYKAVLIPILHKVGGRECYSIMASKNYMFVGAQGLMLVQELDKGDFLPKNHWVASFDQEHSLYIGSTGHYMVPSSYNGAKCNRGSIKSRNREGLNLMLRPFTGPWNSGDYLLCFSKI